MSYAGRASGLRAINAYANVGLETQVLSASPERLITLLFAGARAAIGQARLHMQAGRIAERGSAISKAIRIVDEGLRAGLDMKAGGDLAENLDQLYDYVVRTLLSANLTSDSAKLDEADALLENIGEAWKTSVDRGASLA